MQTIASGILANCLRETILAYMQIMTDDLLKSQLAWLRATLRATEWSPTRLAHQAGLSPSTLLRPLGGKSHHNLSARTLDRISRAASAKATHFIEDLPLRAPTNHERLMRARKVAEEMTQRSVVTEIALAEMQALIYDILTSLAEQGAEPTDDALEVVKKSVSEAVRRRNITPKGDRRG